MNKQIVLIPGDGIGPEIIAAAQAVLTKAAAKSGMQLTYETHLAGGAAIDAYHTPLPAKTLAAVRRADAILLGAVGGPQWDQVSPEIRPEKAILGLRKELGLYANLRPVRVPAVTANYSTLKPEIVTGVDMLIVRELNGGIYYGERMEAGMVEGREQAWDTEIYSRPEIERILRLACQIAKKRRNKVTSVDKANVLASSRLWRKTAGRVAKEYGEVRIDHMYVDNCAMQLVLSPKQFDVVVTSNLFGDILSDEASVLTGSIGMMPSASLGDGPGLYEPIHGSAPDIAGRGIANPIGTILSAALLMRHSFGAEASARQIEAAVERSLADGYRTADLYQPGLTKLSTEEMGRKILENFR